jgi:hypothetical protein
MKNTFQPSGLNTGLNFLIDKHWTPEQALAVFELLDDLRDFIFSYYQRPIQELLQEERGTTGEGLGEIQNWDELDF